MKVTISVEVSEAIAVLRFAKAEAIKQYDRNAPSEVRRKSVEMQEMAGRLLGALSRATEKKLRRKFGPAYDDYIAFLLEGEKK